MMSEQERHRQLVEWNATDAEYPRDRCLHELVVEQVRRTPHAVAVSDRRGRLTFAELDDQAGRLASHLRDLGIGPDGLVGICMDRSTDMLVALLGVLKAGGAFVPLQPDQPRERLLLMLGEARPGVVITTAQARAMLPETAAHLLVLDAARETWMSSPPAVTAGCGPRNLAYVLFTSGSTGVPKGVMIEHRSIVNQLVWRIESFGLTAADRLLQKTPLGFPLSLWELFCPLLTGAALTMLDPGAHIDPRRLADAVRAERISVLHFVPSMLEEFLNEADTAGCESVRLVLSGGEALTEALARRAFERFGPAVVVRNAYGQAEATCGATSWTCDPLSGGPIPIGRPVANTRIYLLDARLRPVPIGVPGELWIGGVQVARGYLNRRELTAERFVDSPFVLGDRIYRTGDMARYRNDGAIEFLGRRDDQIKIRGARVELGEIEAAIRTHPRVRQAIAAIRADADGHQRLVAYLVPGFGQTPTVAEMRAFLAERLPAAMLPSAVVVLEAIPLTSSGKTDRRALPDPDWAPLSTFQLPRTEIEERLASLWSRTLRVDRVGVDDDFFELGGHSLLAVRLLASVEREFGVLLPLTAFLGGHATVAGMATVLEESQHGDEESALVVPVQSGGSAPGLFFVHPDESTMLTLRHFRGPLGPDQRVVGLLPERIGRRFDQSRRVEDLATPMLEAIRSVQPHGPYHIAGFSFGGLLAYELAGRLREDGEPVGWLAILDCMTPEVAGRLTWLRSPRGFLTRLRERGARRALRAVRRGAWRALEARLGRLRRLPTPVEDDFDFDGAAALRSKYICRGHDAPLELFVSADTADMTRNPSLGWEDVHKGALTVHEVPGRHLSLITEPHVHDVADIFSASLRRAQVARATPSS
jgi:amino acid adenylation domain-containing protein